MLCIVNIITNNTIIGGRGAGFLRVVLESRTMEEDEVDLVLGIDDDYLSDGSSITSEDGQDSDSAATAPVALAAV